MPIKRALILNESANELLIAFSNVINSRNHRVKNNWQFIADGILSSVDQNKLKMLPDSAHSMIKSLIEVDHQILKQLKQDLETAQKLICKLLNLTRKSNITSHGRKTNIKNKRPIAS